MNAGGLLNYYLNFKFSLGFFWYQVKKQTKQTNKKPWGIIFSRIKKKQTGNSTYTSIRDNKEKIRHEKTLPIFPPCE